MKERSLFLITPMLLFTLMIFTSSITSKAAVTYDFEEDELIDVRDFDRTNDDRERATVLPNNKTCKASIGGKAYNNYLGYDGDDWFCFDVDEGDRVTMYMSNYSGVYYLGTSMNILTSDYNVALKFMSSNDWILKDSFKKKGQSFFLCDSSAADPAA